MNVADFPLQWDGERLRKVPARYEEQTEDEAAFESQDRTVMEVPNELVPTVRELIAQYQTQT